VAFVPALFVAVVCAQFVMCLIAWIGTALFVLVVGVLAVNTAGLEALALALRGALLVVAFVVVMLVVIATAVVAKLALLASTMMMTMIIVVALSVRAVALALISEMAHLARVLLLQLLAHLAPCFCSNLFKLMALEAFIVLTSLVD
jgi:hypothetical protein